jgi:transposase
MWHLGIDLHRRTVVVAAVRDSGETIEPRTFGCRDVAGLLEHVRGLKPFRAVVEATSTYRWLYDLLSPEGTVLLAHPAKLRLMIQRRAKTDRLDCQLLANLLRIDQIPLSYVPPKSFQQLRDVTRYRSRLVSGQTQAKIGLRSLLARHNREAPYRVPFGPRGLAWFQQQEFGAMDNFIRDELVARLTHYRREIAAIDRRLTELAVEFPVVESLIDIDPPWLHFFFSTELSSCFSPLAGGPAVRSSAVAVRYGDIAGGCQSGQIGPYLPRET